MKVKTILIQAFLLATAFQSLSGQPDNCCNCTGSIKSGPYLSGELFVPDEPLDISTYFNRDWLLGDIYLANGKRVRNSYIKYNKLLDELLWLDTASNKVILLDKEGILQFHFLNFQGDTSVSFKRVKVKRYALADSTEIFGEEIYSGIISLFILHKTIFEGKEPTVVNGSVCLKNVYDEEPIYYLRLMNNKIAGLTKISRKSLSALFPGQEDQIKKFFKENRQTEFNTNPALVKTAQFLSTIVKQQISQ